MAKKKQQDLLQEDEDKRAKLTAQPREDNDRKNMKDYSYFFKVYNKINDSMPEYMKSNLRDMPNNKGYIWRGCWCLGSRDSEYGQPLILFEKIRGNITRIHEYDTHEYRLYQKIGKERKTLVTRKNRLAHKMGKMKY